MRRAPVSGLLAILLAVLSVGTALSVVTYGSASAAAEVDPQLSRSECALTGRAWTAAGCSRNRCVKGATMLKLGHNAELCQGRGGWGYGQPISARWCQELGRVWLGEINICASNPDRSRKVVRHAPQCSNRSATYVNHSEEEGYFDECISPHRLRKLERVAEDENTSLGRAAKDRNRYNCSYRPGWVMQDGVCVVRQGPPRPGDLGGTFMTGDSVSWRGENELDARKPDWVLDLRPGRRLDELADRLAWFRANHGEPDRVLVQLGTNRRNGYSEGDFRATMATIPSGTPVLLFLPFRHFRGDNAEMVAVTKRHARWMKRWAAQRPRTCVADWPSYASKNLSNLVDGEHPDRQHEDWYARYVVRSWDNCERRLGL